MHKRILISSGDPSGDLHASNLVRALRKNCALEVTSLGGKKLESVSDKFLYNLVDLHVYGFWEPFKQYFNLRNILLGTCARYIKENRPDLVILVDYYGFNINLAELAHSMGIPVFYFISPQVWATRYGRIYRIKKYVKKVFVIFPFEEEIYRKENIPVTFIGHPFLDTIPDFKLEKTETKSPLVGFFPGSRKQVLGWHLPIIEKTAELIKKEIPGARFVIAGLPNLKNCYKTNTEIWFEPDYETRQKIDLAITTSGTVSLENMLLGIPMIVFYRMPYLMYRFVKSIISIKSISMANIITGKKVIPEFIQDEARPENISNLAVSWLKNPEIMYNIRKDYREIRQLLGEKGAIERLAKLIAAELK